MKKIGFVLLIGVVAGLTSVFLMDHDGGRVAADATSVGAAGEPTTFTSFAQVRDYYQRKMFASVKEYLSADEEPSDAAEGYQWAMQTTLELGCFDLGGPLAIEYLKRHGESGPVNVVIGADLVAGIALAQQGDYEGAQKVFEGHLARNNAQLASVGMSFADMLAVEFGIGRKPEVATAVYEKLLAAYGTSPFVRDRVESRIQRLELLGKPAPRIAANDRDGKWVNLDDYKGKVVFVDFWATWCGPCLEELPNVKAAYEAYHDKGLEIIGVNLDDSVRALDAFLEQEPLPWRTVFGAEAAEGPIDERYVTGGTIPATYLIDKEGNVAAVDVRGARLQSAVRQLLGIEEARVDSTAVR